MPDFQKRVAILGAGFGTRVTVPALRAEGWDVRALFSRRPERAEAIATKLEIPHYSADAHAILARDDVDMVVVSTPTSTHHDMLLAALAAGKHVLCEKPLASNQDEGRAMVEAAEASGLTVMCNFEFRFSEHRLHITQLLEAGQIGRPQSAIATLHFARPMSTGPLDWRSRLDMGGGALNEHCSHYFDALRGWMGDVTTVSAHVTAHEMRRIDPESRAVLTADADDFVSATLTFESGAVAIVGMVWSERVPASGMLHLTGTEGTISHTSPTGLFAQGSVSFTARLRDGRIAPEDAEVRPQPKNIESLPEPEIVAASRRLLREFELGVAEGCSREPNLNDGLYAQAMLDAARESSRASRVVEVVPR